MALGTHGHHAMPDLFFSVTLAQPRIFPVGSFHDVSIAIPTTFPTVSMDLRRLLPLLLSAAAVNVQLRGRDGGLHSGIHVSGSLKSDFPFYHTTQETTIIWRLMGQG